MAIRVTHKLESRQDQSSLQSQYRNDNWTTIENVKLRINKALDENASQAEANINAYPAHSPGKSSSLLTYNSQHNAYSALSQRLKPKKERLKIQILAD